MTTSRQTGSADQPALADCVQGYTLGPFATNCYLVRDPGSPACWIVDASWGAGQIADRCAREGLVPERLLLTHAHPDHIAGIPEILERVPGLSVAIHTAERGWLADPAKNLSARLGSDPIALADPDELLEDGQTLALGDLSWRVLHTPGHSPGGVSFYCESLGVVIAGDTLFQGSIGRFDFPSSNEADLFASIREKLYALPDDTVVLPGHGGATTIAAEKASNPYVRPQD